MQSYFFHLMPWTDYLTFISHELRTALVAMSAVNIFDPHSDPKSQAKMIDLTREGYRRIEELVEKGLKYFEWLATRTDTAETTDLAIVVRLVADRIPGPGARGGFPGLCSWCSLWFEGRKAT